MTRIDLDTSLTRPEQSPMIGAMFQEKIFSCGDFNLNGASSSAPGPPLVFFHGVARRWQDFMTLMPPLTSRWTALALDFRGHGRSDRSKNYRIVDHVRDALAFMSLHIHEPAILFGHSLGALVAAAVAAERPESVRALVLEDPPSKHLLENIRSTPYHALFVGLRSFAGQKRSVRDIAHDLADFPLPGLNGVQVPLGRIRDAVTLRFMAKCLQMLDPEALTPAIEGSWLEGYDVERIFRNVRCSTLLLRADEGYGGMLAQPLAEQLTGLMSDCVTIDFPGVGHQIHWLKPEDTARYLMGFLETL